MLTYTTRVSAAMFASLALAATALILFWDVWQGAALTLKHSSSAAVLAIALGAGHLAIPSFRGGRYLASAGLALAFLAATAIIIVGAAGRNAEQAKAKSAEAGKANAARAGLVRDIAEARRDHGDAKAAEARECVKVGPQCQAKARRSEQAWSHVLLLEARLQALPAEQTGNAEIAAAAELLALIGLSSDRARTEAMLGAAIPYATALVFEIAALALLAVAFPHRRPTAVVPEPPAAKPSPVALPAPPEPEASRREQAIDFVRAYKARHGREPKLAEMQSALGTPRSSASRYRRAAV